MHEREQTGAEANRAGRLAPSRMRKLHSKSVG